MTLASRVTVFFLATLAVVLVGFSCTLYALAWRYVYRQVDERLEAALNTMVAAAEVNSLGVEWEPSERTMSFGRGTILGAFRWWVIDDGGLRMDGSVDRAPELERQGRGSRAAGGRPVSVAGDGGAAWRVIERRLTAAPAGVAVDPADPPSAGLRPALILGAALSLEGPRATLRNLGLALMALSAALWLAALALGRGLVRRALRPLALMAESARGFRAHDLGERLPTPTTGDELQELGQSFNALLGRLEESFERQSRFTGDASHQLRTPLTSIQGQVDLALRKDRTPDEYRRVLAIVQEKTRRLRQIVDALLFLARADGENQDPRLETVELNSWAAEFLAAWSSPRSDDVRLELAPDPAHARVQPALLGEMVANLLDNACKYSDPGTPIRLRVEIRGAIRRLSVADRGQGIDPRDLPHLFEPFFRTDLARQRTAAGLGLGLAIAGRLARSFGGEIMVASAPGEGSTFSLELPGAVETRNAHPPAEPELAAAAGNSACGP